MSMTTTVQKSTIRLSARQWLLIILGFFLLVLPLVLPRSGLGIYWQAVGLSLLGFGSLYIFFSRDALVTVCLVLIFATCFEAPLKYLSDERVLNLTGYLGRDILLYTLVVANFMAYFIRRNRTFKNSQRTVIPLLLLIVCFLLHLMTQVFNPAAVSPVPSFLNSRIFWEMLPLYFIGFISLRSKKDWRVLFFTFLVVTTINGIVGAYQASVGPDEIVNWGPGYKEQIIDAGRVTKASDRITNILRPFGLGSDSGFSGSIGVVAVPMVIALLSTPFNLKRFGLSSLLQQFFTIALIGGLVAGVFTAIAVSGSRSNVLFGFICLGLTLFVLALRGSKTKLILGAIISTLLAAVVLQVLFVVAPFFADRYSSVGSVEDTAKTFEQENRAVQVTTIPLSLAMRYPLGDGLDYAGPGADFANRLAGTKRRPKSENTENNINIVLLTQGLLGLGLWLALHLQFIVKAWQATNKVVDDELRVYMSAAFVVILFFLIYWPFGNLISFPQNTLFWLLPGMVFGSLAEERQTGTDAPHTNV
jgi:hypothetical protein